jgi:type IV pilus assembly protein PilV
MKVTSQMQPSCRRVSGFTLLEVLIALLVMCIGVLGIGKMVLLSSRANDSAYMRGQATALAYSILDAMRANRQAALSGSYAVVVGQDPAAVVCTAAAPCSSGLQAQNDLSLWKTSLTSELPAGDGSVTTVTGVDAFTGADNVTATVTVQWLDTVAQQSFGGVAPNNTVSITLETIL